MSRAEAATYIGVSISTYDQLVRKGLMPNAKRIGSRLLWDRRQIEIAFANLPETNSLSEDDEETKRWAV